MDQVVPVMLNYLDDPDEADAFVGLVLDEGRTGRTRLGGYEVCRAMSDLGRLGARPGRDAARMAAETLIEAWQHDDHEEGLRAAQALCHFAQNAFLVVCATLDDDGAATTIKLNALVAPDFQGAIDLWENYSGALAARSQPLD